MRRHHLPPGALLGILIFQVLFAGVSAAQSVANVRFRQTEEDQVEIFYDLGNAAGDTVEVELWLSQDGGESFTIRPRTVTGDVGEKVEAGDGRRIVWDVFSEIRKLEGTNFVFKVVAKGRELGVVWGVGLPGGVEMEFVWIEPGTFVMGASDIASPEHEVTISRGFYLGKYEITQGQWEAVMGTRPWSGQSYVQSNPTHPAVYISWNDVQELIVRLNAVAGEEIYRLPTEAEWEYACRAGTSTRWSLGDDESQLRDYAWYDANAWNIGEKYAHAVGTKLPNPWGLYDMHGNVWEWCEDWYGSYSSGSQVDPTGPVAGSDRVLRGGNFYGIARYVRSAFRSGSSPGYRSYDVGVRLSRTR